MEGVDDDDPGNSNIEQRPALPEGSYAPPDEVTNRD